ncbi:MAG: ATP phosphoribosyltransferase regulatory subunit [Ruthenibacterium sp.]
MNLDLTALPKEEQVTLVLRRLFEQYGYLRYRMSNFESYDLYSANKSFLKSEGIITFTDGSGRLMALKPDVTMSIVKNSKENTISEKLYYIENVFRATTKDGEYREISQMGIEFIGANVGYPEAEVVALAADSLAAISADAVLDISHMGFVTALLDDLNLAGTARADALEALQSKNAHTLHAVALAAGCNENEAKKLASVAFLAGKYESVLPRARTLAGANREMCAAVENLQALCDTLHSMEKTAQLRLDFSIIHDIDYYNGIIFQGYVRGVPHAVLAGGRYDNLMRRFGKTQAALGFALYLGELGRAFAQEKLYDADTLLLYDTQSPACVAKAVQTLTARGERVRAEAAAPPQNLRVKRVVRLRDDGETEPVEVEKC